MSGTAPTPTDAAATAAPEDAGTGLILGTVVISAVVLAVFVGIVFCCKRLAKRTSPAGRAAHEEKVRAQRRKQLAARAGAGGSGSESDDGDGAQDAADVTSSSAHRGHSDVAADDAAALLAELRAAEDEEAAEVRGEHAEADGRRSGGGTRGRSGSGQMPPPQQQQQQQRLNRGASASDRVSLSSSRQSTSLYLRHDGHSRVGGGSSDSEDDETRDGGRELGGDGGGGGSVPSSSMMDVNAVHDALFVPLAPKSICRAPLLSGLPVRRSIAPGYEPPPWQPDLDPLSASSRAALAARYDDTYFLENREASRYAIYMPSSEQPGASGGGHAAGGSRQQRHQEQHIADLSPGGHAARDFRGASLPPPPPSQQQQQQQHSRTEARYAKRPLPPLPFAVTARGASQAPQRPLARSKTSIIREPPQPQRLTSVHPEEFQQL